MSFKEKAVSWRQEVHIGKTKPRLIKAAILLLCFGVLIGMAWYYSEFSAKDCAILVGICVLTLAIYMIDMPVHPVIRILFALVIPVGCFYTFETLTHQMSTMIELAKRLNIAFYYWLFLFVFFIAGRTSISMAICVAAIAIIGVGNYFVVMFRSNPIVLWDIYSFETAMSVADNYVFSVDWALAEHIAMFILMLIVGVRTNIRLNKKILRPILTVAMCIPAYFYISYLWQDNLERNTGLNDTLFNAKYMHSKDGFFVSFILDIHFLQIEEPKNYSDEYALSLLNEQEVEKVETPEELPDIIAIMDETFSDPAVLGEFETNKDYMPFVHSILRGEVANTISGYTDVSVLGGNTANSEFELITGMNLDHFGAAEYPYKTVLQNTTTESMATVLKNYGYKAHAIHDNSAAFYDRDLVFSQLGFDTFTTKESMNIKKWTENGWAKDQILTGCIMDSLDSTKGQDYVYCISVQGHGDYPTTQIIENPEITVEGIEDEALKNKYTYYVNQVYQMDQFVGKLVKALQQRGEPTILCMYGDHLPSLEIEDEDLTYGNKYQTSYFMWDNIGLKKKDGTIEAYDLGSEVLNKCNIHTGLMNSFHQKRYKKLSERHERASV